MIALDASVLIAHFDSRDAHHAEATELLAAAAPGTLTAHSITCAEVLVGGARVRREAEMLGDIRDLGVSPAPHGEEEFVELARLRVSTGRRLPDCCVLHTAITSHASVATFDSPLRRAAQALGLAVMP